MLTYFAASKTVDFLIHGVEEYTAVIIMSEHSEEIRQVILRELERGVTVYKGRRGMTDEEQDILFCVVTRLEIGRIKKAAHGVDGSAFIVVQPLADAEGGVIRKLALH